MSQPDTYISIALDADTPAGSPVQWRHADVLGEVVGDFALKAQGAKDFRERAFYQHSERTLDELLRYVWRILGPRDEPTNELEQVSGSGHHLIDAVVTAVAEAEDAEVPPYQSRLRLIAAETAISDLAAHLRALEGFVSATSEKPLFGVVGDEK